MSSKAWSKNGVRVLLVVMSLVVLGAAFSAGHSIGQEKAVKNNRLYELRTYTTHDGRLEALHKRFREHTIKLFEKHGTTG